MCLAVLSVRAVLGHPLEAVGEGSGDDAYESIHATASQQLC